MKETLSCCAKLGKQRTSFVPSDLKTVGAVGIASQLHLHDRGPVTGNLNPGNFIGIYPVLDWFSGGGEYHSVIADVNEFGESPCRGHILMIIGCLVLNEGPQSVDDVANRLGLKSSQIISMIDHGCKIVFPRWTLHLSVVSDVVDIRWGERQR